MHPSRCTWSAATRARAALHSNDVPVEKDIDDEGGGAQPDLKGARQVRRIEQRQNIVLNEVALVGRQPASLAKIVFERRQRTDPACEFDEHAPNGGRHVHPNETRPAHDEQTAEDDEYYECSMHADHEIGGCYERSLADWNDIIVTLAVRDLSCHASG